MKIDSIFEFFDREIGTSPFHLTQDILLSDANNRIVQLAYRAYARLLVDVSDDSTPVILWGRIHQLVNLLVGVPILVLQEDLNHLYEYFLYNDQSLWEIKDFKGPDVFAKRHIPCYRKKLLWPVYNRVILRVIAEGPERLSDLASLCKFLSKLELDRPELEQDCITSYCECEEWLFNKPKPSQILVKGMNEIIREWFHGYNPTFLPVRHGNGSVADCKPTKWDKYCNLKTDAKLRLGIEWLHGFDPCDYYPCLNPEPLIRTSKYITVPKSLTKRRGISMEPATLQYFQQGVMITLYDYIVRHLPQIPIRNQEVNRDYARVGSLQGTFCTIDLSNASDLVDYSLVKQIFHGTSLLKFLMCTRSDHTRLPDGRELNLMKFAPMGSALCFPTESIVFAACAEFIRRQRLGGRVKRETLYSVYGDDIIINNSLYDITTQALVELGFRVNMDKSFNKGPFRESCGGDYYKGRDVTSIKYRLTHTGNNINANDYSAICTLTNQCASRGYFQLRKYFLSQVLKTPGPLFTDTFGLDPAVWSPTPTNFNNKVRWNSNYQRTEIQYLGTSTRKDRSLQDFKESINFSTDDAQYLERLIEREYHTHAISESAIDKYSLGSSTLGYRRLKHLI